ncbi:MAG: DUF4037 domain-containing protein [Desulfobacterium sp.]|nr:DUF4037 domain-containing protein [Desulfobacterium sp.]MBU3947679.1 DUF4037 domain-containing protein [Pseudomonadota bacterium]
MKGLELSRRYYDQIYRPAIEKSFGDRTDRMAFGLVGEGSECYGFDDEISQDHDFGPRVIIWLTTGDFGDFGAELQAAVSKLPKQFLGYDGVNTSQYGEGREGVFTIPEFYARFIGMDHPPDTIREWRLLPEVNLSIATNGEVFSDPLGEFTKFRSALLAGYPEDQRLKMMAARCMKMAQSGQYNYPRSIKRNEFVAAQMAAAEFTDAASSLIYLINNKYKPFYKWMHRGLLVMPVLGEESYNLLAAIATSSSFEENISGIETLCGLVINKLRDMGLTDSSSDFLLDHGPQIQQRIKDEQLRNIVPWGE